MTDVDLFQTHRTALFAVAYRMLGSATDAEDVLQDAWLRFSAAAPPDLRSEGVSDDDRDAAVPRSPQVRPASPARSTWVRGCRSRLRPTIEPGLSDRSRSPNR